MKPGAVQRGSRLPGLGLRAPKRRCGYGPTPLAIPPRSVHDQRVHRARVGAVVVAVCLTGSVHWTGSGTEAVPGNNGVLSAVACVRGPSCEAVGTYFDAQGTSVAFGEGWRGGSPVLQSVVVPSGSLERSSLDGVACVNPNFCVAVGSYNTRGGHAMTLAERWNGGRWLVELMPTPKGQSPEVTGIACIASGWCIAVGGYQNSLGDFVPMSLERSSGAWHLLATPAPPGPMSGAAASFLAVSCTSSSSCIAVGDYRTAQQRQVPLGMSWNGTLWSLLVPVPPASSQSSLSGVSCVSTLLCAATGYQQIGALRYRGLAERLSNTWSAIPVPTPGGASVVQLASVACPTATSCVAVGKEVAGSQKPLATHWTSTRWTNSSTPSVSGVRSSLLSAVSCVGRAWCFAVGNVVTRSNQGAVLAMLLSQGHWKMSPSKTP